MEEYPQVGSEKTPFPGIPGKKALSYYPTLDAGRDRTACQRQRNSRRGSSSNRERGILSSFSPGTARCQGRKMGGKPKGSVPGEGIRRKALVIPHCDGPGPREKGCDLVDEDAFPPS